MTQSWSSWYWHLGLASFLAIGAEITSSGDCALAQPTPDASLGAESSVTIPLNPLVDKIEGGAIRGTNLFHSFLEFNVGEGRGAYFTNPAGIENILSRVTGGNLSNIRGTLGVLGNANLFLINPNGIIFGQNASLDVRGSFVATTANAVRLGDTGLFSASEPVTSNLLTVNPSALFFKNVDAKAIVNQSKAESLIGEPNSLPFNNPDRLRVGLQVPAGQTLALVGGDVVLNGGHLTAAGGRIELGSVAGTGEVSLNQTGNSWALGYNRVDAFRDIRLEGRLVVDASGAGGGNIQIQGAQLELTQGGRIFADTLGTEAGGEVLVQTTQAVTLRNGSFITADVVGSGTTGTGGNVTIETGQLSVRDGSLIRAGTLGKGKGGNLSVSASESVEVVGTGTSPSGSFSRSGLLTQTQGAGAAGNLTLTTRNLSVQSGARISTATNNDGQGGNLSVTASESVELTGTATSPNGLIAASGLYSQTQGAGTAGNLTIATRRLSVKNGAVVSASTFGKGKGGNLSVTTSESVELMGTATSPNGQVVASGLYSQTERPGTAGNLAVLTVNTERLTIQNRAGLFARNTGSGSAGKLQVQARSINLDQGSINADSASGSGGDITLRVGNLQLRNSNITTNAGGTATGGNITINTGTLVAVEDSDIRTNALGGPGGRVVINAQGIFRTEGSDITATSALGPQFSGTVEIITPDFDLSRGLVDLPAELVDVSGLIAQSCPAGGGDVARGSSEFFITGRGGLPPKPGEALRTEAVVVNGDRLKPGVENGAEVTSTPAQLVEAQGWVVNAQGQVVLIASAPTITPNIPSTSPNCYAL